jgi:hypothetical protein
MKIIHTYLPTENGTNEEYYNYLRCSIGRMIEYKKLNQKLL